MTVAEDVPIAGAKLLVIYAGFHRVGRGDRLDRRGILRQHGLRRGGCQRRVYRFKTRFRDDRRAALADAARRTSANTSVTNCWWAHTRGVISPLSPPAAAPPARQLQGCDHGSGWA